MKYFFCLENKMGQAKKALTNETPERLWKIWKQEQTELKD